MRSQIYLVLIRDGSLALAVGAGLENRLLRDGSRAMALVPAVRGPEFADSGYGRQLAMRRPGSAPVGHGPQVVALYEDGLLADLASLGLPAYVGVRDGGEPRVVRWAGGPGAIMLPVATARDLVDAVADHTPWSRYAAGLASAGDPLAGAGAAPVVPGARQPGHDRLSARSRRVVTVASVAAGPLLLAGLPPAAIAASGVSQPPALAAAASSATKVVLAADTQQAPPAVAPAPAAAAPPAAAPAPPANAGPANTWGNYFTNLGTSLQNYTNATVTGAGNFLSQVGTGIGNTIGNAVALSNQAQQNDDQANQALANKFVQNNAAAVQAGNSWGKWAQAPGQAIMAPVGAALGIAATSETGPGMIVGGLTGYANGAKVGAAAGRATGFFGGYLGYQLTHLSDSSPSGTTSSTPASTTNPILGALQYADQTGHAWVGDPFADTKMVGEAAGWTGFTILNNMRSTQGAAQAAGTATFFPTGANTLMGNLASRFGNGWAIMNAAEYTGGFLYGLGKYVFTSDGSLQPGTVTVGSDGSVTITSSDGKTVTTITPDGTVLTTVDGNTTVMAPGGGPAVSLADFFKSMFAVAGSPQSGSEAIVGPDGVTIIAPDGTATAIGANGPVTTTPGSTAPGGTAPGDTAPGDTAPGGTAPGSGTAPGGTAPGSGTQPGGTTPPAGGVTPPSGGSASQADGDTGGGIPGVTGNANGTPAPGGSGTTTDAASAGPPAAPPAAAVAPPAAAPPVTAAAGSAAPAVAAAPQPADAAPATRSADAPPAAAPPVATTVAGGTPAGSAPASGAPAGGTPAGGAPADGAPAVAQAAPAAQPVPVVEAGTAGGTTGAGAGAGTGGGLPTGGSSDGYMTASVGSGGGATG
jgi:hypothetical protein